MSLLLRLIPLAQGLTHTVAASSVLITCGDVNVVVPLAQRLAGSDRRVVLLNDERSECRAKRLLAQLRVR